MLSLSREAVDPLIPFETEHHGRRGWGWGGTHFMHSRSLNTIDPRIPTMRGRRGGGGLDDYGRLIKSFPGDFHPRFKDAFTRRTAQGEGWGWVGG